MFLRLFNLIFSSSDLRVHYYIKLISLMKNKNFKMLGLIFTRRLQRKYGNFISFDAEFDDSLILRHPIGIVIGNGVKIGKNVTLFQNVTLGTANTGINSYPEIGCNTIIYAGSVVIGDIKIGKNCIIGANSVVTNSIPDNSVAIGSPARVIKNKGIL